MSPVFKFTLLDDDGEERDLAFPGRWEICDRCRGNGTHDHPAFSNGLTSEDFEEDPDFREEYLAGRYDVRCEECGGEGKVAVPDVPAMRFNQRRLLVRCRRQAREIARDRAADAYTRRMENGGRE